MARIDWRVLSVDDMQGTAVILYVCGEHRIERNIAIADDGVEASVGRFMPKNEFSRATHPASSLAGFVGKAGTAEVDLTPIAPKPIEKAKGEAGTVVG